MTSLHSHSNNATGPIIGLEFLHRMTQAWKDRHIAVFMCSAPVWTGSVVSVWHGQNPADPPFLPLPSPLLHHPERRGCRAPVVSRKGSLVLALPCLFMLDAFLCMLTRARHPLYCWTGAHINMYRSAISGLDCKSAFGYASIIYAHTRGHTYTTLAAFGWGVWGVHHKDGVGSGAVTRAVSPAHEAAAVRIPTR